MENILAWVGSNKEWLFSGIGVLIISTVITLFIRHRKSSKQIQKSGSNSVNIQVGGNLNISSKDTNDERIQKK